MVRGYWLVKQEPTDYSWDDLMRDRVTAWTGVRNFQARNHLKKMREGDQVLVYHSGEEKSVVGTAVVAREAYPDRTAEEGDWVSVDLRADTALKRPVSLKQVKEDAELADMLLVRQSRLSVMPVTPEHYKRILDISRNAGDPG